MPRLLVSPGHQQPGHQHVRYWICGINRFLSSAKKGFNYIRANSRLAPSQWETPLQSNDISLAGRQSRISPVHAPFQYWEKILNANIFLFLKSNHRLLYLMRLLDMVAFILLSICRAAFSCFFLKVVDTRAASSTPWSSMAAFWMASVNLPGYR